MIQHNNKINGTGGKDRRPVIFSRSNNTMEISKASLDDSTEIYNVFRRCKEKLISQNIYQWDDEYPNIQYINEDINRGALYKGVLESRIVAVISFDESQEKEYGTIN